MPARHLDLPTLELFATSRLDRSRMIEAGRHLFACERCRTRLGREVTGGAELVQRLSSKWPDSRAEKYEGVFERIQVQVARRILIAQQEQVLANALADELEAQPPEAHASLLRADQRLQNAVLVDVLLERSRSLWGEDAERAERLARLGLDVADHLDPARYGQALVYDLKARSWAFIGNALKLRSDLREAEYALARAESLLQEGSYEPLERALFLEIKASLLRAQRRLGEALDMIHQSIALYRRVRDSHLEGRALVCEAMILALTGEQEQAIATYFRALERIDPERDPHLAYATRHNLMADLVEAGRVEEALPLLPEVRRSAAEVGHHGDHLRLTWLEGLVDLARGIYPEAEVKLRQARSKYVENDDGFLAALVSLDLAKLYLEQGRTADTRRRAAEMKPIFLAKNISREAIAALLVFQHAAEQEAASVMMVQDVARRILRVQGQVQREPERPA